MTTLNRLPEIIYELKNEQYIKIREASVTFKLKYVSRVSAQKGSFYHLLAIPMEKPSRIAQIPN